MYFKQSKYKSFQRQLYLYEFTRITAGPNTGAYYHPKFVRGLQTLCLSMAPKRGSKQQTNTRQNSYTEKKAPPTTSLERDPSDWMTKINQILVHGADFQEKSSLHATPRSTRRTTSSPPSLVRCTGV